jgi:hypothetical protein
MEQASNELIAYRLHSHSTMKLVPGLAGREWMNKTNRGFANRCLPMRIASQAGWMVLNDRTVRAKWDGGAHPSAVVIEQTGNPPFAAISHFGHGILTFLIPFLFRTPAGIALLIRGPANAPKDAIAPLEGLVETDWAVAGSSVNWKFTRTDISIEFAVGEPICMVVPQRLDLLEATQPRILDIRDNPEMRRQYGIWSESCRRFSKRLSERDPEAVRLGWQRYYFKGRAPHNGSSDDVAKGHRSRLSLREFATATVRSQVPPLHLR